MPYEQARKSDAYAAVLRERVNAVVYEETYVCLENVSIPLRVEDECHKKMTLLGRTMPDVSFEDFTPRMVCRPFGVHGEDAH